MTTETQDLNRRLRKLESNAVNDHRLSLAIQAWFIGNSVTPPYPQLTTAHREACEAVGISPKQEELRLSLLGHSAFSRLQRRPGMTESLTGGTLTSDSVADGGAIAPPAVMMNAIEKNLLWYGGLLQVAQVIRTDTRSALRWPTADDTANKGRRIGESGATAAAPNPVFGAVAWDLYKYTSDEILVPYEMLNGIPILLAEIMGEFFGVRIGRKLADDFTNGTGINQPSGLMLRAKPFAAAGATGITWDDVNGLISSVDPAYRIGASFMFHDNVRLYLSELKDGNGRPLWDQTYDQDGRPLLKGFPCFINNSMDSTIASGKKTISYGQHSNYKIYQFRNLRISRLTEKYRESDQDAFIGFLECDGNLLDAGTPPVKYLQH